MAEYTSTRSIVNGCYNVDNPLRLDGSEKPIHLAKELETALPGKIFTLCCSGAEIKLCVDGTLTSGEQTTLSTTVTAHEDNT
jgi:hypothetical protein